MNSIRRIVGGTIDYRRSVFLKLHKEIESKITELLEIKHLYQNVHLDTEAIEKFISKAVKEPVPFAVFGSGRPPTQKERNELYRMELQQYLNSLLKSPWQFATETVPFPSESKQIGATSHDNEIRITLPTIKIPCEYCDNDVTPHNSGFKGLTSNFSELNFSTPSKNKRLFFFPYQCQGCKGEPVIFLVRLEVNKLQLVGRSLIESVPIPNYVLKEDQKFYKEAVIAFNCGRTLAALFYLRTMIEQYTKRILGIETRITGEELCDRCSLLLPDDFPKERYPSLRTVYEELSEKIHNVDEDEKQFKKSLKDIEKHFDLLQHFPLKENDSYKKKGKST